MFVVMSKLISSINIKKRKNLLIEWIVNCSSNNTKQMIIYNPNLSHQGW